MIFDDNGDILIHQSWLDDAMRCPERGRLKVVKPDWCGPSDATSLGTGAHAAVEAHINAGGDLSNEDARLIIARSIDEEIVQPNMSWNKYDDRDELFERAVNAFFAWRTAIWPILPRGGFAEVNFKVPLSKLSDGRTIFIEGQIDYVPLNGNELWDWKFPGRKYDKRSKQKYAIQPTIYGLAAVMGGLTHVREEPFDWPMRFVYGLGVTGGVDRQAKAHTFDVHRTAAHANFAILRLQGFVDLALNFGLERPWPQNDDHFLCSAKWCDHFSICKGAHQGWREDMPTPD